MVRVWVYLSGARRNVRRKLRRNVRFLPIRDLKITLLLPLLLSVLLQFPVSRQNKCPLI
jgi:hypothetical protein